MTSLFNAHRPEKKVLLEAAVRRLGLYMARAAVETAGAFFQKSAELGSETIMTPGIPEENVLHCTQRNVGQRYEMTCGLSVEKSDWDRLFKSGESDAIKADALSELANCICGSILAEASFTDEFGYLNPCVPSLGAPTPASSHSKTMRGSMVLRGAWIYFAFTVQDKSTAAVMIPDALITAVAA